MQQEQIKLSVVPDSFLSEMKEVLDEIKVVLEGKSKDEINSQWVESGEARRLLGVSQKTWQTYRDKRVIPFSQFGRKIFVQRKDLEQFMLNHKIKAL